MFYNISTITRIVFYCLCVTEKPPYGQIKNVLYVFSVEEGGGGRGGQCEAEQNLIDLAVVVTTSLPCVLLPIIL